MPSTKIKPVGITIVAGLLLILPAAISIGSFSCGQTIISPGSMFLVIPLMFWTPVFFIVLIPTVLFWLWSSYLFEGSPTLPKRTKVLGYTIAFFSIFHFVVSWGYGKQYQGTVFTAECATVSLTFAGLIFVAVKRNERQVTYFSNLVATWLIFTWIFTYAFPYLGETP